MRRVFLGLLCLAGAFALSACQKASDTQVEKTIQGVNVIEASHLDDIMLSVADPNEAVSYFTRTLKAHPDRIDLKRDLAKSLIRAGRSTEAVVAWAAVVASSGATSDDKVDYVDALIRNNDWKQAKAVLDTVPPTHATYKRYRLAAMVADANKQWARADSFYKTAAGMTTQPAGVYNNWGFSKLSRGDYAAAEKLFVKAITYNKNLFTAKNNLVLARAAQKKYTLPIVPMTQTEKAKLLYTMALSAIKQGDVDTGRGLLQEAIDTNPQYYPQAARALAALDSKTTG